jgi:hypothetical protein
MKYIKSRGRFENSTGSLTFDPINKNSYSYGWWKVSGIIKGHLVYNSFGYSPATIKHQATIRRMLNYTYDYAIEAPRGLDDLPQAIRHYEGLISDLKDAIAKPGTRKAKNLERQAEIDNHLRTIEIIKSLMGD